MQRAWLLALGLVAAVALPCASALLPACNVDAINVDGCRKIESTRCHQAVYCPALHVTDATGCERFYRDQCLHGLATDHDPGGPAIAQCVAALEQAGQCAQSNISSCPGLMVQGDGKNACDVIEHPELTPPCAFLVPPPPSADAAADAWADHAADASADGME